MDVGGTKIAAALVSPDGTTRHVLTADTPDRRAPSDQVEQIVVDLVGRLSGGRRVPVGIGAAGFVDSAGTTVRFSPHVNWCEEPVAERLTDRLGMPVTLDNDANAAGWAEYMYGAGHGEARLIFVGLGTGIGGALIYDGLIERGAHGMAGEFGHMNVVPGGRECPCGQRGCWERYCSGTALIAEAVDLLATSGPAGDRLRTKHAKDASWLTGRNIAQLARHGDPGAAQILHAAGIWLGRGLSALAAALDPGRIVIGGGLSGLGDVLLEPARLELARTLAGGTHRPLLPVMAGALGPHAGVIGAADLARRAAEAIPGR
ncbi:MAG: ROK family protein [Ornithinimicrobium sp.]